MVTPRWCGAVDPEISGQPIKFIGTGEKVEALQPFHPERMASRILGMGDVLTLVEKAQEVELADVEKMQKSCRRRRSTSRTSSSRCV